MTRARFKHKEFDGHKDYHMLAFCGNYKGDRDDTEEDLRNFSKAFEKTYADRNSTEFNAEIGKTHIYISIGKQNAFFGCFPTFTGLEEIMLQAEKGLICVAGSPYLKEVNGLLDEMLKATKIEELEAPYEKLQKAFKKMYDFPEDACIPGFSN